ncbi:methyltransferase domain-containing protein [Kribbella italica]|uniref:SAM-dependent methyltransferase n=1 Tax=Kribbella italica TaxID=1540520 RepID=A0A7W9J285_9ACTN|nr:SAM-dependent methyltransferase [Kribbella italica]
MSTLDDAVPVATTGSDPMERLALSRAARDQVETWANGAQALALLTSLRDRGWTQFLLERRELAALADFSGLPPDRLTDVLAVLEAHGIVEQLDGHVQLSASFEALAAADAWIGLDDLLDRSELMTRLTRTAAEEPGPLPLTEPDALVVARAAGGAAGAVTKALYEQIFVPQLPELSAAIKAGPWLDAGCGVACATLTLASLYPEMEAVAIELVPTVAAETVRRAEAFGVTDRIDIRVMDARELDEADRFSGAFWAQPFFPEQTRAETLAMLLRVLQPGGVLLMQEMEPEPDEADRPAYSLRKLVAHGWGVPFGRTAKQLADEAKTAGFEIERLARTDFGRLVIARRPV